MQIFRHFRQVKSGVDLASLTCFCAGMNFGFFDNILAEKLATMHIPYFSLHYNNSNSL